MAGLCGLFTITCGCRRSRLFFDEGDGIIVRSDLSGSHLFPRFKSFASFNERFQPGERRAPAILVTLRLIKVAGESGMTNAHHSSRADFVRGASMQTANFVRLEFPANDGGERADEIGDASVNQQSRRVDLEVLALEAKLFAIVSDAGFIPFSAGTKIGMTIRNVEEAFHSPPLRALLEIGDRFEDAAWRSWNEDLRQDG